MFAYFWSEVPWLCPALAFECVVQYLSGNVLSSGVKTSLDIVLQPAAYCAPIASTAGFLRA